MDILSILIVVLGLCLFEALNSIDNAIVNAEMLRSVSARARRWFLSWGLLFAVFFVRGLIPLLIVWISTPQLGISGAFLATLHADPSVREAVDASAPLLLFGSGTFLMLFYLHWLVIERHLVHSRRHLRFFIGAGFLLATLCFLALTSTPRLLAAVLFAALAFLVYVGLRTIAAGHVRHVSGGHSREASKLVALELVDMTFSIDGVVGAFAFTFSIPLIILGNSFGAILVRKLTLRNAHRLKDWLWLRRASMLSILCVGLIMVMEALDVPVPKYASIVTTVLVVIGYGLHARGAKRAETAI